MRVLQTLSQARRPVLILRSIRPQERQVESLRRQFVQAAGLPFADVLSTTQVQAVLSECQVTFRERIFSPLITVSTFLSQVLDPDHSMRQAVARLIAYRASLGMASCSPDTRAYSKARQRLPEKVWAELTRRTGTDLLLEAPARWCWRGRDVRVVDGWPLSMPDTPANQQAYPQSSQQKPGLGFPVLRIVALFSLAVGTVLDVALGPRKGKQTGETALFRTLHHHLADRDVLLADRYFCGYFHFALLPARGADVVLRLHHLRHVDFRRGRRLEAGDHLIHWSQPPHRPDQMDEAVYARLPQAPTMRALRIRVPHKECRSRTILVATTLLDGRRHPKRSLAE